MIQELVQDKKEFRFIDGYPENFLRPLVGVSALWPTRVFTEVVEISLGGFIARKLPQFEPVKNRKLMEMRLQIPGLELTQPYDVEIEKITENFVYFVFDIKDPHSRLLIEQVQKDEIIKTSLQLIPLHLFQNSQFQSHWFHGAFETNFVIWTDAQGSIVKWALEYDNTILFGMNDQVWTQRSSLSKVLGKSYFLFDENFSLKGPRMSLGNTWLSRLIRLIEGAQVGASFDFHPLLQKLRAQRTQ